MKKKKVLVGIKWKKILKRLPHLLFLLVIVFLLYTTVILKPSHTRNWEVGFEKLPRIRIQKNIVSIEDFRNYEYGWDKIVAARYMKRQIDISTLERAWFIVEPFEGFPIVKFDGIAHTYFVFDFKGQKPVVVSVEARREKGEKFGLLPGILNRFELMYVWGSEEDLTAGRVLREHNQLYMYPLTISKTAAQKLFVQLAQTTQGIEKTPRFYHSLTSNCTNELAKNANQIKPGTIPYDLTWFLPGFAAQELYKLGFIPNSDPLPSITKKYYISELVKEYAGRSDFSELLRKKLE